MYKNKVGSDVQDALTLVINDHYGVDINKKTREQSYVTGRSVYYKLLREMGYGFTAIAETLNKNHATVIHHIKTFNDLLSYDKNLRHDYEVVREIFYEGTANHPFFDKTRQELINDNIGLEKQIKSLNLFIERLNDGLNHYKKYDTIIKQLDERTVKDEDLTVISRKLNHILNGLRD